MGRRSGEPGESVAWRAAETNRLDTPVVNETPPAPALRSLAAAWLGASVTGIAPLPTAGFSGSAVHEVRAGGDRFVLKELAASTDPPRAAWVHALAGHLRAAGIAEAPDVAATPGGDTVVADDRGRLWELVRLVPGSATTTPTPAQAAAAMDALARIHRAAATLPGVRRLVTPAPALALRIERARGLLDDPWRSRRGRLPPAGSPGELATAMRSRLDAAVETFQAATGDTVMRRVAALLPAALPLSPALRDVWSEHVLFAADPPDRVAGIIDFHAAGMDSPAADIARLLGSWPRPGSGVDFLAAWSGALAAYEAQRPLEPAERSAIPLLHAAGVVFGLDNWFRWVLEEGRAFPDPAAVLRRADRLLEALPAALQELGAIAPVSETGRI